MIDIPACPACHHLWSRFEDDLLYERSTIIRFCDACETYFEVIYFPNVIKEVRKLSPETIQSMEVHDGC